MVPSSTSVAAPLTIASDVTITFSEGAGFTIDPGGSITAIGTADKPIVLRGKQHTPGFWSGINFLSHSAKNILRNTVIEYAGKSGGVAGADVCVSVRALASVQASEIAFSETAAIRLLQDATLNPAAAASNRLHDNKAAIVSEQ